VSATGSTRSGRFRRKLAKDYAVDDGVNVCGVHWSPEVAFEEAMITVVNGNDERTPPATSVYGANDGSGAACPLSSRTGASPGRCTGSSPMASGRGPSMAAASSSPRGLKLKVRRKSSAGAARDSQPRSSRSNWMRCSRTATSTRGQAAARKVLLDEGTMPGLRFRTPAGDSDAAGPAVRADFARAGSGGRRVDLQADGGGARDRHGVAVPEFAMILMPLPMAGGGQESTTWCSRAASGAQPQGPLQPVLTHGLTTSADSRWGTGQ
jgi:hypothetical protein